MHEDCDLCKAGSVEIGGWHYTQVGGMIFPTNRRCPWKARTVLPDQLLAIEVPLLQCVVCKQPLDWLNGQHFDKDTTHLQAECRKCELVVRVPARIIQCEVVK